MCLSYASVYVHTGTDIILVTFAVTVIKYPDKSNIRDKAFLHLAHQLHHCREVKAARIEAAIRITVTVKSIEK